MGLLRLLRIFIPLLLVAAIIAGVVVVWTSRSELQSSRRNVEDTWTPLGKALDQRYAALAVANNAVSDVPGPLHAISTKVTSAYNQWQGLERQHAGVSAEVNTANSLEALGRRLVIAARAAPRLKGNAKALAAIALYAGSQSPSTAGDYNQAVDHFEKERNRPARSVAAQLLGYDSIPAYTETQTSTTSTTS
jgi:hypothetical protein